MNSDDKILYHYTSLEVFKCLFENYSKDNPNLIFWATNCTYMNDPKEITEGINLVRDILKNGLSEQFIQHANFFLDEDLDEDFLRDDLLLESAGSLSNIPYAVSFSKNADNLNMWRMYGDNGSGVALGFSRNKLRIPGTKLIKCIYNTESEIKEYKERILSEFTRLYSAITPPPPRMPQEAYDYLMTLGPFCRFISEIKNKCYSYEQETRAIADCNVPKFRIQNGILKPYTEVKVPINALDRIIIGPTCSSSNLTSIKLLLRSKGLYELSKNILVSGVPYRN